MEPTADHDSFEEGNGFGTHHELEMREIFNPCPTIPNATGAIPYDGLSTEVHDLQTLYAAFNDPSVHDDKITGKRKIAEDDDEFTPRKHSIREIGEGSGASPQNITKIQVTVDPKPPDST
ncbi:hypothetical protein AALP_AA4G121100 [Arabis alpina]|uniref:Uncharacterized protein n=1 Tax=Arabis alpina TaxID=50452 RepID=A0A087H2R3_ARAAL|nr:hypothetical protein AALP_AA4G121100 [Arabis alpina]